MPPHVRRIIRAASEVTSMPIDEINGLGRHKNAVFVRAAISRVSRARGHTLGAIGRELKRDHTTVLHYIRMPDNGVISSIVAALTAIVDGLEFKPIPLIDKPKPRYPRAPKSGKAIIAPYPPGTDKLLLRGHSILKLRKAYPNWRIGRD